MFLTTENVNTSHCAPAASFSQASAVAVLKLTLAGSDHPLFPVPLAMLLILLTINPKCWSQEPYPFLSFEHLGLFWGHP